MLQGNLSLPSVIQYPGVLSTLHFARQKGDSRDENYCSVSNMAGNAHLDPPWLLSSLDKSGVKNGLSLIGIFALSFNSISPFSPNKKLFLELIGQNKRSNMLQFGKI